MVMIPKPTCTWNVKQPSTPCCGLEPGPGPDVDRVLRYKIKKGKGNNENARGTVSLTELVGRVWVATVRWIGHWDKVILSSRWEVSDCDDWTAGVVGVPEAPAPTAPYNNTTWPHVRRPLFFLPSCCFLQYLPRWAQPVSFAVAVF